MRPPFAIRPRGWTVPLLALVWMSLPTGEARAAPSLGELLDQLQHPRVPLARIRAAEGLAQYGEHAVPPLRKLLHHSDPLVRNYACLALVRLGPQAASAVPELIKIAGDDSESGALRETAVLALAQIGPQASPGLAVLKSALSEDSSDLRIEAGYALAAIGTPEAVTALIEALEQVEGPEQQDAILVAFWKQGAKALSAASQLLAVGARHPESELGDKIFLTVATFGPEVASELAAYLQADQLETRRRAAVALSRLGPDAGVAVPALCKALKDASDIMRFWAAKTLGCIGSDARPAIGPLLGVLGDVDPNVRWQVMTAIARIDPQAITEDDWSRLLTDSDPGVRQRAAMIRAASL